MQVHEIERRFDCAVSRVAHQGIPGKNVPIMYGRIDNTVGKIVEVVGGPGRHILERSKACVAGLAAGTIKHALLEKNNKSVACSCTNSLELLQVPVQVC